MWRQLERREKGALHKYFLVGAKLTKSMLSTALCLGVIITMAMIPFWQKTAESGESDFVYAITYIMISTLLIIFPISMFIVEKPIYKYVEAVRNNQIRACETQAILKQTYQGLFRKTYCITCKIPMPDGKKRCRINVSERVYNLINEKDRVLVVAYDKGSYKQLFLFDLALKGVRKRKGDMF